MQSGLFYSICIENLIILLKLTRNSSYANEAD